jgi:hypothetical protein
MKTLIFLALALLPFSAKSQDREAQVLRQEFLKLYESVKSFTPDSHIDEFKKYKLMENYEIIWDLAEDGNEFDVITIYRDHAELGREFTVTYYRGTHLVAGRNVVRRFVGPVVGNWRNDTADFESLEYLGMQGHPSPEVTPADQKILSAWKIELFNGEEELLLQCR